MTEVHEDLPIKLTGDSRKRRVRWLVLGGLSLILASIWAFDFVARSGPALSVDGAQGYCQPSQDGRASVGGLGLFNLSSRNVRIVDVRLLDAQGLSLIEARLLPTGDLDGAFNSRPTYPPPRSIWPNWERSVLAVGALVPPTAHSFDVTGSYTPDPSQVVFQLVVGVVRDEGADEGRAAGVEVTYRSGIRTHVWVTSPAISVPLVECAEDWDDFAFYMR